MLQMRVTNVTLGLALLGACGPTTRATTPPSNTPPPAAPSSLDMKPASESTWRQLLGGPLEAGCVAVDAAGEALCVTESGGLQAGTTFELAWLSPTNADVWPAADIPSLSFDPARLDADTQARALARLVRGGYGAMPAPTWGAALAQDSADVATIDDPAVRIVWTRTAGEHIDAGDGAWTSYHDVVKSERPAACALGEGDIENPGRSELRAWRLPGGAVLVERDTTWAIEGDRGGDTVAQVIAPGRDCPP
jgi:hypothetical protein